MTEGQAGAALTRNRRLRLGVMGSARPLVIGSALAAIHALFRGRRLTRRIDHWLPEGIDIGVDDPDLHRRHLQRQPLADRRSRAAGD